MFLLKSLIKAIVLVALGVLAFSIMLSGEVAVIYLVMTQKGGVDYSSFLVWVALLSMVIITLIFLGVENEIDHQLWFSLRMKAGSITLLVCGIMLGMENEEKLLSFLILACSISYYVVSRRYSCGK